LAAVDHPDFETAAALRKTETEVTEKLRQVPHHLDEDSVFVAAEAIFGRPTAALRQLANNTPSMAMEIPAGMAPEQPIRRAVDQMRRRLFTGITDEALRVLTALALHVGWGDGTITMPVNLFSKLGALSGGLLSEMGEPDRRAIQTAEALIDLAPQHTIRHCLLAQIEQTSAAKEAAIDQQDFGRAAAFRDAEKELLFQESRVAVDDTAVFAAASTISGLSIAGLRQLVEEFTPAVAGDAVQASYTLLNDEPVASARGDLLGTDSVAGGIASLLASSRSETPFVLAVDASWGMGKSTLLRQVESRLTTYPGVATVRFNEGYSGGCIEVQGNYG
jgi:hypothetical protein